MPNRPTIDVRPFPNMRLRREPEAQPEKAEVLVPVPPEWLTEAATPHWATLAIEMVRCGTFRPLYASTLGMYAELLANFIEAPDDFSATRLTQMRLIAGDLGLSPSHANRVARVLESLIQSRPASVGLVTCRHQIQKNIAIAVMSRHCK